MDSEYTVVSSVMEGYETFNAMLERFEALVSAKLREGWVLAGGICTTYNTVYEAYRVSQAMTRKRKAD